MHAGPVKNSARTVLGYRQEEKFCEHTRLAKTFKSTNVKMTD